MYLDKGYFYMLDTRISPVLPPFVYLDAGDWTCLMMLYVTWYNRAVPLVMCVCFDRSLAWIVVGYLE